MDYQYTTPPKDINVLRTIPVPTAREAATIITSVKREVPAIKSHYLRSLIVFTKAIPPTNIIKSEIIITEVCSVYPMYVAKHAIDEQIIPPKIFVITLLTLYLFKNERNIPTINPPIPPIIISFTHVLNITGKVAPITVHPKTNL